MRLIILTAISAAFVMLSGCGESTTSTTAGSVAAESTLTPATATSEPVPTSAAANEVSNKPTQFTTVKEMIEEFGDYDGPPGSFKILKQSPLHFQISPTILPGSEYSFIDDEVKRALIYGVYRSFIHTPVDQVTVTVKPLEVDPKQNAIRLLDAPTYTVSITRQQALTLIQKAVGVQNFDDLIATEKVGDMSFTDQPSKAFERIRLNDQGAPGRDAFISELMQYKK